MPPLPSPPSKMSARALVSCSLCLPRYYLLEHPGYDYGHSFNASLTDVMRTLQAVGLLKPGYVIPDYPPPVVTPWVKPGEEPAQAPEAAGDNAASAAADSIGTGSHSGSSSSGTGNSTQDAANAAQASVAPEPDAATLATSA
jgi:hypothetical protein